MNFLNRGPRGFRGISGTVWHTSSGPPTALLGNDGDFCLDTLNSEYYGPKTGLGWGAGTSIIGPPGANGTDGATGPAGASVIVRQWSASNGLPTSSPPQGPFYLQMGTAMQIQPDSTVRRERCVRKMKPVHFTAKFNAGAGAGIVRFEIYKNGVATGDLVDFANNITGVNRTVFPVQGTINVDDDFDARFSVLSGSTIGALVNACFTVEFEEVP